LQAGDAHYYLGLALLKKHDADAARAELRKAVDAKSARATDAERLIAQIQEIGAR